MSIETNQINPTKSILITAASLHFLLFLNSPSLFPLALLFPK
uniref:Uncharacterized protein n=1 Tax=Arundo donax TaxID=35708 RepID=A0A0A9HN23_ARUDO